MGLQKNLILSRDFQITTVKEERLVLGPEDVHKLANRERESSAPRRGKRRCSGEAKL